MADSSFDIVSKLDRQEVDNALGQTAREIATRFDFKGDGRLHRVAGREGDRDLRVGRRPRDGRPRRVQAEADQAQQTPQGPRRR